MVFSDGLVWLPEKKKPEPNVISIDFLQQQNATYY